MRFHQIGLIAAASLLAAAHASATQLMSAEWASRACEAWKQESHPDG